jgi:hypothetical protein
MSSPSISSFNNESFLLDFKPDFMSEIFKGLDVDYQYFKASHQERVKLKNMMNFHEKFEYAYAITTHVSQGSQFNTGIYMQEYFPTHSANLNYTGISRFRERALYVVPDKKKFWKSNYHNHRKYYHDCDIMNYNIRTRIPVPKADGSISF